MVEGFLLEVYDLYFVLIQPNDTSFCEKKIWPTFFLLNLIISW